MTFDGAVRFCEEMDAFMPILRADDSRQKDLARRIDNFGQLYVTEAEKYNSFGHSFDIPIWITSVALPSNQCGWMSSRTGSLGEQNCANLLPFVCEKGTKPYSEPYLWRKDLVVVVLVLIATALIILLLLFCNCRRSQDRKTQHKIRENFLRQESLKRRNNPFNGVGGNGDSKDGPQNPLPNFDAMNPQENMNFKRKGVRDSRHSMVNKKSSMNKKSSTNQNPKNISSMNRQQNRNSSMNPPLSSITSSMSATNSSMTPSTSTDSNCCSSSTYNLPSEPTYTTLSTDSPPPPYKTDTLRSNPALKMVPRKNQVNLRPDPYDSRPTTMESSMTTATSATNHVNSTYDSEVNSSFMTGCSNCSSMTQSSSYYCSTCSRTMSMDDSIADSDATLTENVDKMTKIPEETMSMMSMDPRSTLARSTKDLLMTPTSSTRNLNPSMNQNPNCGTSRSDISGKRLASSSQNPLVNSLRNQGISSMNQQNSLMTTSRTDLTTQRSQFQQHARSPSMNRSPATTPTTLLASSRPDLTARTGGTLPSSRSNPNLVAMNYTINQFNPEDKSGLAGLDRRGGPGAPGLGELSLPRSKFAEGYEIPGFGKTGLDKSDGLGGLGSPGLGGQSGLRPKSLYGNPPPPYEPTASIRRKPQPTTLQAVLQTGHVPVAPVKVGGEGKLCKFSHKNYFFKFFENMKFYVNFSANQRPYVNIPIPQAPPIAKPRPVKKPPLPPHIRARSHSGNAAQAEEFMRYETSM